MHNRSPHLDCLTIAIVCATIYDLQELLSFQVCIVHHEGHRHRPLQSLHNKTGEVGVMMTVTPRWLPTGNRCFRTGCHLPKLGSCGQPQSHQSSHKYATTTIKGIADDFMALPRWLSSPDGCPPQMAVLLPFLTQIHTLTQYTFHK